MQHYKGHFHLLNALTAEPKIPQKPSQACSTIQKGDICCTGPQIGCTAHNCNWWMSPWLCCHPNFDTNYCIKLILDISWHICYKICSTETQFKLHTTDRRDGLHPTMNGSWRKAVMQWARRTGSSLCKYWALRCKITKDQFIRTDHHPSSFHILTISPNLTLKPLQTWKLLTLIHQNMCTVNVTYGDNDGNLLKTLWKIKYINV